MTNKAATLRAAAESYLANRGNYPSNVGEMSYRSYAGWTTDKKAHPCELKTHVIDRLLLKGELLNMAFNYDYHGWAAVAYVQRDVLCNFVKSRVILSEQDVNRLLFDHGITLIPSKHGDPAASWVASVRFGKVLDHYAVSGVDAQEDRILSKLQILVRETGHNWEDFI